MQNFKIYNNTDNVDIDQKSLGLSVTYEPMREVNDNRGLHVQIRHNNDKLTYELANQLRKLLTAAPDMLGALLVIRASLDQESVGWHLANEAIKKVKGLK
jgi:hypothetical protein